MGKGELLLHCFALIIRLSLIGTPLSVALQSRPEISTPASSHRRLLEGVSLYSDGISPYDGDNFHEHPFLLWLFASFVRHCHFLLPYIFIACDHISAVLLAAAAKKYLEQLLHNQKASLKHGSGDSREDLLVQTGHLASTSIFVQACYLLNPFCVACCVAMTTSVLNNLLISISFFAFIYGMTWLSVVCLAIGSTLWFYPCVLIVPVALRSAVTRTGIAEKSKDVKERGPVFNWGDFLQPFLWFFAICFALLYLTATLSGSWTFIRCTYEFFALVPDLQPNVGIFWYFFTEVFDHFRPFFLWVFQLNIFIYVIPLALTLRYSPVVLFTVLLMLLSVFKPYPSIGDAVVYAALLPVWRHLWPYIRHGFVTACTIAVFTVLAPVMWKLWIMDGSANANFYFAITIAYCIAQIFLLTDLLYAELRHGVHLKYGKKLKDENGNEAKVMLQ